MMELRPHRSVQRKLLELFPAPRFLRMPAAGVDISDSSVKFAILKNTRNGIDLDSFGAVPLPSGTVVNGEIFKKDALVTVLKKIHREYRVDFAHASLSERHAYLFECSLPRTPDLSIEQAIEFRLKENVPLSPDEAVFDYLVLNAPSALALELSVSVYPTVMVTAYRQAFLAAGITPLSFEIDGQASAHALASSHDTGTFMIVDLGAGGAELSIVSRGMLEFTTTLEFTGDDCTKGIEQSLSISHDEAERLKQTGGLVKTKENEAVFNALLRPVAKLRDEIGKHFLFWQIHSTEERASAGQVERVLLCGGNAAIKGLPEYLGATLEVPVELGNTWANFNSFDDYLPAMPRDESFRYATVVGLALRSLVREGVVV